VNSSFQVPAIFECEEDTDAPCDKVSEDNNDKDKEIIERQNREDAISLPRFLQMMHFGRWKKEFFYISRLSPSWPIKVPHKCEQKNELMLFFPHLGLCAKAA
jgi:hypothetical protein